MRYFYLPLLTWSSLAWARSDCDDKNSCFKDLEAYCRVAFPVEPVGTTLTVSDYTTVTTTTTTTETYVGITDGRVKLTAASLSLKNAEAFPTPTAVASIETRKDAMIRNLCACIQSPETTVVATTTTSFTSTETETATRVEVYCRQGCHRDYEYCDTDAPPLKDKSVVKHPAGVCRPTGNCEDNSDCITKKGKKNCNCLVDYSDIEMERGYCISDRAVDCEEQDAQICEDSSVCPKDYVCLKACKDTNSKFCIKPRTYMSFCEVVDPPWRLFGQTNRAQQPVSAAERHHKQAL